MISNNDNNNNNNNNKNFLQSIIYHTTDTMIINFR